MAVTRMLRFVGALVFVTLLYQLPAPSGGLWRRSYVCDLPMPTLAAWNAPPAGLHRAEPAHSPVGVGAYLETETPAPQVAQALDALEYLKGTWARNEIPWSAVEPERGKVVWDPWDRVVEDLRARDYRVLGMLCYWTPWVTPYTDQAITAFGRYCERVARRYRGRVPVWEVWNEPNSPDFWGSTPECYVKLLRAAYEGVKRGDPDALVLGGSLSGVDLHYLRRLLDLGAARWMDALSVHPYTFGWDPEASHLSDELRGASAAMAAAGASPRIWVTEIGRAGVSPAWMERAAVLMLQSGVVEAFTWHALYDCGWGYGLYGPRWRRRPVALRYHELAARLDGARALGSGLPSDVTAPWGAGSPRAYVPLQVWCFARDGAVERVAWCPGGKVRAAALAQPGCATANLGRTPCWESMRGPTH